MARGSLLAALCLLLQLGLPAVSLAAPPPVAPGAVSEGVSVWRGLRYAEPPVGALRWAPPVPVAGFQPFVGRPVAARFGPPCPQPAFPGSPVEDTPPDEDCLFLNVWAPTDAAPGAGLPVLLWFHGGGFAVGSGSYGPYDGAALARRGAVVVTVNYRLGEFGFFAHPALTAERPDAPTNQGLLDALVALRWVHDHVAAFGGDPANVTVFGESAGGRLILALMTAERACGSFRRAVVQSGGGWGRFPHVRDRLPASWTNGPAPPLPAEAAGLALAERLGITGTGPEALSALRTQPVSAIITAGLGVRGLGQGAYGPILDGVLLTDDLAAAFAAGPANAVPLVIGANDHEATLMHAYRVPASDVLARLGPDPGARARYGDVTEARLTELAYGDTTFLAPARWLAARTAASGQPAWLYHFTYLPEGRRDELPGVPHGGDVPFVFDTLDRAASLTGPLTEGDRQVARRTADLLVAFARDGRPAAEGWPDWPAYDPTRDATFVIGPETRVVDGFLRERLDAVTERLAPR